MIPIETDERHRRWCAFVDAYEIHARAVEGGIAPEQCHLSHYRTHVDCIEMSWATLRAAWRLYVESEGAGL